MRNTINKFLISFLSIIIIIFLYFIWTFSQNKNTLIIKNDSNLQSNKIFNIETLTNVKIKNCDYSKINLYFKHYYQGHLIENVKINSSDIAYQDDNKCDGLDLGISYDKKKQLVSFNTLLDNDKLLNKKVILSKVISHYASARNKNIDLDGNEKWLSLITFSNKNSANIIGDIDGIDQDFINDTNEIFMISLNS
ncbi:MAG: hypothetical protein LBT75_02065 [Bacilli bacterium]|nr:hypothetical protein [Bacilli bacterium]